MIFILDGSFTHYKELKKTYSPAEWKNVSGEIISFLENQPNNYPNIYTSVLIEEGKKKKLLAYVRNSPSSVVNYYKHLLPEFREDVYAVFVDYIGQVAARANNRKAYQEVCAIIRNLKKAGGTRRAAEIKQHLCEQYANRPAFKDELSRV